MTTNDSIPAHSAERVLANPHLSDVETVFLVSLIQNIVDTGQSQQREPEKLKRMYEETAEHIEDDIQKIIESDESANFRFLKLKDVRVMCNLYAREQIGCTTEDDRFDYELINYVNEALSVLDLADRV